MILGSAGVPAGSKPADPGGEHFGHIFGIQADGGNGPSDQNGLARESLNLRSMDYGGSVDMSVFR